MKTVWTMTAPGKAKKAHGKHPTQKPIALVERCILASTQESDFILAPFLGGGTTALAALKNGRRCVGIESDDGHIDLSINRVRAFNEESGDLFAPKPMAASAVI